jgi:hypothetical protein
MIKVTEISSAYRQHFFLPIDGSDIRAEMILEFKPTLNCWFFSLTWDTFETGKEQLITSQNVLRQYQGIIPFGIGVLTKSGMDPLTLDAFTTGEASLYILTQAEVLDLEAYFHG